jgi:UDP-glucose 4-epimerase
MRYIIGDIRDYHAVVSAVSGADILFNAAALKRVETCEKFPDEAISTNYIGASNIVRAIREMRCSVKVVIGVGSDKGAHPMNIYGATKFLQECRLLVANYECPHTRFVGVRYGNVMASRGSVIPIWQEQIRQGKPITITDPAMTRFLISLDQAVDTLLAVLEYAERGEVYIPHLPAAAIGNMAQVLVENHPVVIEITGKGFGEKMHEVLITEEEANRTVARNGYYVVTQSKQPTPAIDHEYISRDCLVSSDNLKKLFIKYGLLAEDKVEVKAV